MLQCAAAQCSLCAVQNSHTGALVGPFGHAENFANFLLVKLDSGSPAETFHYTVSRAMQSMPKTAFFCQYDASFGLRSAAEPVNVSASVQVRRKCCLIDELTNESINWSKSFHFCFVCVVLLLLNCKHLFFKYVKHCFIYLQLTHQEKIVYVGLICFSVPWPVMVLRDQTVCLCVDNPETPVNAPPSVLALLFPKCF